MIDAPFPAPPPSPAARRGRRGRFPSPGIGALARALVAWTLLVGGQGAVPGTEELAAAATPGDDRLSPAGTLERTLAPGRAPGLDLGQELVYRIPRMELSLELLPDGDMVVRETIRFQVEAGDFGEGYRRIPLPGGVSLTDLQVTSPDLEIDSLAVRRTRRSTEITWHFPRRDTSATFTLRYRVEGALLSRDGENIIDWDAVGAEWAVPLEEVQVAVRWPHLELDEGSIHVAPPEDALLTRGEAGSEAGDVPGDQAGAEARARDPAAGGGGAWIATFTPGSLPPRTSYRVRVTFPERIQGRLPPEPFDLPRALVLGLLAALAGAAPGVALLRSGSHPRPVPPGTLARDPDSPEASAAVGVPETGFLTQGALTWAQRVFPATLVSLARRGHLVLEPGDAGEGAGTEARIRQGDDEPTPDLRIRRSDPAPGAGPLSPSEEAFLHALEAEGSWKGFHSSVTGFQQKARAEVARALEEGGFVVQENRRSVARILLGTFGLALSPLVLIFLSRNPGVGPEMTLGFFILFLAAGFGMIAAGTRSFDLTDAGDRVRREHQARMTALRSGFSQALKEDPGQAHGILVDQLEWFLLDPRHGADWFRGVERRFKAAGIPLELPGWLVPGLAGGGEEGESMASLLPFYLFLFPSTQGTSGGVPGSGTGSVGVGASGGFGGGGGGIR